MNSKTEISSVSAFNICNFLQQFMAFNVRHTTLKNNKKHEDPDTFTSYPSPAFL